MQQRRSHHPYATQLWLLAMLSIVLALTIALYGCDPVEAVVDIADDFGLGPEFFMDCDQRHWWRGTITSTSSWRFKFELVDGDLLDLQKLPVSARQCACGPPAPTANAVMSCRAHD